MERTWMSWTALSSFHLKRVTATVISSTLKKVFDEPWIATCID
jgi:hypothetical protein